MLDGRIMLLLTLLATKAETELDCWEVVWKERRQRSAVLEIPAMNFMFAV